MKHLTHTSDFNKEDYLKVFKIIDKLKKKKDLGNICRNKVLALAFFKESTRTLALFQSAIIKLGGGWMGITTKKGTYLEAGEEELEDTLRGITPGADLIAIRGENVDFPKLKKILKIPIINCLAEDEHTVGGVGLTHFLQERFGDLKNVKLGLYGMIGASRPAKTVCRILSLFGAEVYEDSVIPELGMSPEIKQELINKGLKFKRAPLEEFIDKIDFLYIIEGLPQAGTPENLVNEFNEKVKIIGLEDIKKLKKNAAFDFCEPRYLTDGRCTMDKIIDNDPKHMEALSSFFWGIMGTIVYLLRGKINE